MSRRLYSLSQGFLTAPYPRERLTYTSAEGYLLSLIMDLDADWVINIDEDAFVFDNQALSRLLDFTMERDLMSVGMPDGGVVRIRRHHPAVMNPYFNIFNTKKIREHIKSDFLNQFAPDDPRITRFIPRELLRHDWALDRFEPYYDFFFNVVASGGSSNIYLDAVEHQDGITTQLMNHEGDPFLLHTWYSRELGRDPAQTDRILNVIDEVAMKVSPSSKPGPLEKSVLRISARVLSLRLIRPIWRYFSTLRFKIGERLSGN